VRHVLSESAELDKTAHSVRVLLIVLFPIRVRVTSNFPQDGFQRQVALLQPLIKVAICVDLKCFFLLPIARLFRLLPHLAHLSRHRTGPFLAFEFECVILSKIPLECRVHHIQKINSWFVFVKIHILFVKIDSCVQHSPLICHTQALHDADGGFSMLYIIQTVGSTVSWSSHLHHRKTSRKDLSCIHPFRHDFPISTSARPSLGWTASSILAAPGTRILLKGQPQSITSCVMCLYIRKCVDVCI